MIVELPNLASQYSRNEARWRSLVTDPALRDDPNRFETDRFGNLIMSPPPGLPHSAKQGMITYQLRHLLGDFVLGEIGVSTSDDVRVADAGWMSPGREALNRGKILAEHAPEICVEIMSPANSPEEMKLKRALYFDAGAEECWICTIDGNMEFYMAADPDTPAARSRRCPVFPQVI